ncbi:MAG: exonuclease subunit SbcD [Clostridiales bacterium]|jgi:exonuclease SbcD|nr:exonuclease subunit SbcD [Clostridiales bacterium]
MKILHTSDWNIGKKFYHRDRFSEQKAALTEISNIANDVKADLVLVSGNVFGGRHPSPRSLELFGDAVTKLAAGGKRAVVVIAGEKDDQESLKAVGRLAEKLGVTVVTEIHDVAVKSNPSFFVRVTAAQKGFVEVTNEKGEIAHISVVPYIGAKEYAALKGADTGAKLKNLFEEVPANENALKIALVRLNAEDISETGGAGKISREVFKGYAYTALGGTSASIDNENGLFASGAIADYDFDETEKGVLVADVTQSGLISVSEIPLKSAKKLKNVIVSDFSEAKAALEENKDCYVRLIISSDKPAERAAAEELKNAYPLITDILFNSYRASADVSAVSPYDEGVFSAFLSRAGVSGADCYVKLFGAIMEEQHETVKA